MRCVSSGGIIPMEPLLREWGGVYMPRSDLIQWGGLAAMLSGVAWITSGLISVAIPGRKGQRGCM